MKSLLLLACLFVYSFAKFTLDVQQPMTKIAFGSCNKNEKENPLWEEIIKFDPQMWLWLGDVVYADNFWRSATPEDISIFTSKGRYRLQSTVLCHVA
jgi:hypothetical protein